MHGVWPQFLMEFYAKKPSKPSLQNLPGTKWCLCNCISFAVFCPISLFNVLFFSSDLMRLKGYSVS